MATKTWTITQKFNNRTFTIELYHNFSSDTSVDLQAEYGVNILKIGNFNEPIQDSAGQAFDLGYTKLVFQDKNQAFDEIGYLDGVLQEVFVNIWIDNVLWFPGVAWFGKSGQSEPKKSGTTFSHRIYSLFVYTKSMTFNGKTLDDIGVFSQLTGSSPNLQKVVDVFADALSLTGSFNANHTFIDEKNGNKYSWASGSTSTITKELKFQNFQSDSDALKVFANVAQTVGGFWHISKDTLYFTPWTHRPTSSLGDLSKIRKGMKEVSQQKFEFVEVKRQEFVNRFDLDDPFDPKGYVIEFRATASNETLSDELKSSQVFTFDLSPDVDLETQADPGISIGVHSYVGSGTLIPEGPAPLGGEYPDGVGNDSLTYDWGAVDWNTSPSDHFVEQGMWLYMNQTQSIDTESETTASFTDYRLIHDASGDDLLFYPDVKSATTSSAGVVHEVPEPDFEFRVNRYVISTFPNYISNLLRKTQWNCQNLADVLFTYYDADKPAYEFEVPGYWNPSGSFNMQINSNNYNYVPQKIIYDPIKNTTRMVAKAIGDATGSWSDPAWTWEAPRTLRPYPGRKSFNTLSDRITELEARTTTAETNITNISVDGVEGSGNGGTNRVAYWLSAAEISSDPDFAWNPTDNVLTVTGEVNVVGDVTASDALINGHGFGDFSSSVDNRFINEEGTSSRLDWTASDHETRIDDLETTVDDHETRIDSLETTVDDHETRLDNIDASGSTGLGFWSGSAGEIHTINTSVGVGTNNPASKFHIYDSTNPVLRVEDSTDNYNSQLAAYSNRMELAFSDDSTHKFELAWYPSNKLYMLTNDANYGKIQINSGANIFAMMIDKNQRVGIGTATPQSLLHVVGDILARDDGGDPWIQVGDDENDNGAIIWDSTNDNLRILTQQGGSEGGTIALQEAGSGKVGIGTQTAQSLLHIEGNASASTLHFHGGVMYGASANLESDNYVSSQAGWRITNEFNGFAEFGNARIRGTLKTTVFEKESVNAVGGQLWVANSTVLTQSVESDTQATWSVENASGWASNEIAIVKKVDSTGFSTEYILIESSSIDDPDKLNGKLYISRSYDQSNNFPAGYVDGVSGSLGGDSGSATGGTYSEGQVIVSSGLSGSGYIKLNANPRDGYTPYIDIVERTGSGIYDLRLKARVGDLSGLSSALLYGNTSPGHGIYTQNGFFEGSVTATTGSFIGIVHAGDLRLGKQVDDTAAYDGIHIDNNNFWYDNGNWRVGDGTNYLSSSVAIKSDKLAVAATNIQISSTEPSMSVGNPDSSIKIEVGVDGADPYLSLGQATPAYSASGIYFKVDDITELPYMSIKSAGTSDGILFNGSALAINTDTFELKASGEITASNVLLKTGESGDRISIRSADNTLTLEDDSKTYVTIAAAALDGVFLNNGGVVRVNKFGKLVDDNYSQLSNSTLIFSYTGSGQPLKVLFSNQNTDFSIGQYQGSNDDHLWIGASQNGVSPEFIIASGSHVDIDVEIEAPNLGSDTGTGLVLNGSNRIKLDSSSARYKKNIRDISKEDITPLYKLVPKKYELINSEYTGSLIGFIAEDVEGCCETLVNYRDGQVESIRVQSLLAMVVEALKFERKKRKKLENKVAELEEQLVAIKAHVGL